jgi:hypothetical protein
VQRCRAPVLIHVNILRPGSGLRQSNAEWNTAATFQVSGSTDSRRREHRFTLRLPDRDCRLDR